MFIQVQDEFRHRRLKYLQRLADYLTRNYDSFLHVLNARCQLLYRVQSSYVRVRERLQVEGKKVHSTEEEKQLFVRSILEGKVFESTEDVSCSPPPRAGLAPLLGAPALFCPDQTDLFPSLPASRICAPLPLFKPTEKLNKQNKQTNKQTKQTKNNKNNSNSNSNDDNNNDDDNNNNSKNNNNNNNNNNNKQQ
jgi:hypothetical protein